MSLIERGLIVDTLLGWRDEDARQSEGKRPANPFWKACRRAAKAQRYVAGELGDGGENRQGLHERHRTGKEEHRLTERLQTGSRFRRRSAGNARIQAPTRLGRPLSRMHWRM